MRDVYLNEVLPAVPYILSCLDRDPLSPSCGSFDRRYWGWKYKDFSDATLQCAVMPLIRLWQLRHPDNPYYQSQVLRRWIDSAIASLIGLQRTDGCFDQCYPNEGAVGVVFDVFEAYELYDKVFGDTLPSDQRNVQRRAMRRAADMCLKRDETHGEIANHFAQYAYIAFLMARQFGAEEFNVLARRFLDRTLRLQSKEGWFQEYVGADPGYETRTLHYLAKIRREFGETELIEPIRKTIGGFLLPCLHPDGTLGGVHGSRNTSLCYPLAFEIMTPEIPEAALMAQAIRGCLSSQAGVGIMALDLDNRLRLMSSYLESHEVFSECGPATKLPWQEKSRSGWFPSTGIRVEVRPRYYFIANLRKGGVYRLYGKDPERLLASDTGYAIEDEGGRRYCSNLDMSSQSSVVEEGVFELNGLFHLTLHENLKTWQFFTLRFLAATFLRFSWLGERFRRFVAARLFLRRQARKTQFTRRISLSETEIVVTDVLRGVAGMRRIVLTTLSTPMHMASSKYFSLSDLGILDDGTNPVIEIAGKSCDEIAITTRISIGAEGWRLKRQIAFVPSAGATS